MVRDVVKIIAEIFNFSNLCTIFASQFHENLSATAPVTTMGVTGFDSR